MTCFKFSQLALTSLNSSLSSWKRQKKHNMMKRWKSNDVDGPLNVTVIGHWLHSSGPELRQHSASQNISAHFTTLSFSMHIVPTFDSVLSLVKYFCKLWQNEQKYLLKINDCSTYLVLPLYSAEKLS